MSTTGERRPVHGGAIAIVIASVLWGTTGTAATFLPDAVSPLAVGAATMGIGGVLLFLTSPRRAIAVIRDRPVLVWLLIGALGVFVYPLAFYAGMGMAGVAIGTVVALGSAPAFAALLELVVEHRRPERLWIVGTAIALVGMVLLVVGDAGTEPVRADTGLGVLLGLLAGAAYATYTYSSVRVIARGHSSGAVMAALFGLGAVLLLPVLFATGAPLLESTGSTVVIAYLVLGPMYLAYILFGRGLRTVDSSAATTITLIEPVVATLLAVTVVGEELSISAWFGLALIVVGVAPIVTARRPPVR